MAAILHTEPKPLAAPASLQQIVKQCLAKPPGQRYQTMAEVSAALKSISRRVEEIQPSIAVLPFANMSRDADDEYFSDGLAEEIINALTQISGLKVIARTSAFAFKGKNEDIRKIAEALGVTNVLEGSVRRAGSRLRVTAQLIHAADGTHLWSQRYDRELTDVFAVQDDIAAAISAALKVKLTGKPATVRPHKPNLPAYEAFLKARHQLPSRFWISAAEASARAEEYFKQAIALDPQWADPHAALGQQYFGLRARRFPPAERNGAVSPRRSPEGAGTAPVRAERACCARRNRGFARLRLERGSTNSSSWPGLPSLSRRPFTLSMLRAYLSPLGRFEEAIEQLAKAIAQDPLNMYWRERQLHSCSCTQRCMNAQLAKHGKCWSSMTRAISAHFVIALGPLLSGKLAEAQASAEEAFRRAPWSASAVGFLGRPSGADR